MAADGSPSASAEEGEDSEPLSASSASSASSESSVMGAPRSAGFASALGPRPPASLGRGFRAPRAARKVFESP